MASMDSCSPDVCITENGCSGGTVGGRRSLSNSDDDSEFKAKNLFAERRRRKKLSDRLHELRAAVPNITNMYKATIIDDAVNYIQELLKTVDTLKAQLLEMEESSEYRVYPDEADAEDETKCGIKTEVEVCSVGENKAWVKMVFKKRRRRFIKLMEALGSFGFRMNDASVATIRGAVLLSAIIERFNGEPVWVEQTKQLLVQIIEGI